MLSKRLQLLVLKIELLIERINSKIPRFLRITKVSILITVIATFFATSYVYAADVIRYQDVEDSNLDEWNGAYLLTTMSHFDKALSDPEEGTGAVSNVNSLIETTYRSTAQVSAVGEVYATLEDAKLIQPAYAQTPGFRTLSPIRELWKVTRNLSLSLVIIVGLVLAVMILLRVQSGQGYVNILNSSGKLVLTVIMILFSFGIAGLSIDLANVSTRFIVDTVVSNGTLFKDSVRMNPRTQFPYQIEVDGQVVAQKGEYNVFRLVGSIVNYETWLGARDCRPGEDSYEGFDGTPYAGKCPISISDIVAKPTLIPVLDVGLDVLGGSLGDVTLDVIVRVLVLIVVIKIFIALIMAFAKIILRTITAPLEFLFYPISGSNSFMSWFRSILASALTFPAAMALILLGAILSHQTDPPFNVQDTLSGIDRAPELLLHSVSVDATSGFSYLGGIIGVGIISFIPSVAKVLEQLFKVETTPAVAAAGEELRKAAARIPIVGGLVGSLG